MNMIVCIKQVPDTTEVRIDSTTNTLIRQGVPSIVNPFDKHALEGALKIKEQCGGNVTVITMGPPQAAEALKECIVMGADRAVLVSERKFSGSDTLATSYILSKAIEKLGSFDIVFCGKQAIDGDTAQVGPEIAEYLGIPQVTYVAKIEIKDTKLLHVYREQDDYFEVVEVKIPVLLTAVKSLNEPRTGNVWGCLKALKKESIEVITAKGLDVNFKRLGLIGSPTQVRNIFTPEQRGQGKIISGETAETAAKMLVEMLCKACG